MEFRIYYGDGSIFGGRPEDAPTQNVQAIAWDDPVRGSDELGRVVISEYDIYIYSDPIGWHATDKYYDLIQHLQLGIGPGGVRAVLTGRWINWEDFRDIRNRANTDPGLRRKSANRPSIESGRQ